MNDCRAAVITAHNQPLEIQRVSVPDLEPGALLVRIAASTLCGTDVHRWHGPLGDGDSLPIITGHEPCGYVEEINGERTDILGNPVKRGDRLVWSYVACGSCYYCSVALQPCICPGRASWGHNRSDRFPYLLGSCAEYMYVPPPCLIIKVPEEVSSASAAASVCAYRTVMHGFERLGAIKSNEIVVIQGSRPAGQLRHRCGTGPRRQTGAGHRRACGALGSDQAHGRGRRAESGRGHRYQRAASMGARS